jgi:hypothetical protein
MWRSISFSAENKISRRGARSSPLRGSPRGGGRTWDNSRRVLDRICTRPHPELGEFHRDAAAKREFGLSGHRQRTQFDLVMRPARMVACDGEGVGYPVRWLRTVDHNRGEIRRAVVPDPVDDSIARPRQRVVEPY